VDDNQDDYDPNSLAKHFLRGNAKYGELLTEQEREELPVAQAERLKVQREAQQQIDAMLSGETSPTAPATSEEKEEAFRLAAELFREVKADLELDPPE
jgi:hypothetical protein